MSDTKAAEALVYSNSCFHLFVCLVFFLFFSGGRRVSKVKNKRNTHGGNIIPYIITVSSLNSHSIVSCLSFWHYYCIIKAAHFGHSVSFVALWGREVYYFVFVTY